MYRAGLKVEGGLGEERRKERESMKEVVGDNGIQRTGK